MRKTVFHWLRRHWKLTAASCLILLFLLVNLIAYNHAHAMTHFAAGGSKTKRPEDLAFLEKAAILATGINIPRPTNLETPASHNLSFATHTIPTSDNLLLEAWEVPHPERKGIVVMFHGYASCKSSLLGEAKAFHEMGYAALIVDFRGSGGSSGDVTTVGVYEADDVVKSVELAGSLYPGLPMVLYGQSMGSAAILRAFSTKDLSASALVIECPFDKLTSTVENRFSAMGLPGFPGVQLLIFWGGVQHRFNGFHHNPVDYARDVTCPVLLLHGENDARVTKEQAESIYESFPGVKRLEVLPGVGHESYIAARPEQWKQCVAEFVEKPSP